MRIGILGGTFDPIHNGHIKPALEIVDKLVLDKIYLMPNHIPPHKASPNVSTQDRVAMVNRVVAQYEVFELCDIELKRNSPSYLVTSLTELKKQYGDSQLFFLIGTDSLVNLHTWHQWPTLFELCNFVVSQREGWQLAPNNPIYREYQQRLIDIKQTAQQTTGNIYSVKPTLQPYSSTQIRHQLQRGDFPTDALPQAVIDYIKQHKLYQSTTSNLT